MIFEKQQISEGAGKYVKLADGEAKTLILRGEIHAFVKAWPNGKSGRRYSVNAALMVEGTLQMKIWEFGPLVYNKLAEINEEYPIETIKIKVKRTGVELNTEYNILPLLKEADRITPQLEKAITGLEMNVLDQPLKNAPVSFDDSDEIPF